MSDNKERTLFCGNLSERVTEDTLYELFLQAGPLENVTIPKPKDGRPRNFAFITFKHAVSVPYTLALMNGITLYGKPLSLDARSGAESVHNPYIEKLMQYRNCKAYQNSPNNRNYSSPREPYDDHLRRYDSRQYESRPEPPRGDYNQWNAYPPSSSSYNIGMSPAYSPQGLNQGRYMQNSMSPASYSPYGNRKNWSRNR